MSVTATETAPVATVATVETPTELTYSPETLRDVLATVSASGDANDAAKGTLKLLILEGYRIHGEKLARTVDGNDVVPATVRKELSLRMWADAGHGDIPATATRTPGDRSFATYLSTLHTVATDAAYGLGWVTSWETVNEAREGQKLAKSDAKSADAAKLADAAQLAWDKFRRSLPKGDQDKLAWVAELFSGTSTATVHAHIYAASFLPVGATISLPTGD